MTDTPCQIKHCRQPGVLIYLGRDLCCKHWTELARAEIGAELERLKELDLTRTAQGEVCELVAE